MTNKQVKNLIETSTYKTEYIPLYNIKTKKVYAYEALSRFISENQSVVSSAELFSKLHKKNELSFILEKKNKKIQINKSNKNKKVILHFDSNVFSEKKYRVFWKELFLENKDRLIIEITQNSSHNNIDANSYFDLINWLNKHSFKYMISDFGNEVNIFSFESVANADYVKISKSLLTKSINDKSYLYVLASFLKFCKLNNTKTVFTNIENKKEFEFISKLSIDFVQGKYFS